ncbi:hypothetical protein D9M70_419160 [compost metagenome]
MTHREGLLPLPQVGEGPCHGPDARGGAGAADPGPAARAGIAMIVIAGLTQTLPSETRGFLYPADAVLGFQFASRLIQLLGKQSFIG